MIYQIDSTSRNAINTFIIRQWFTLDMVVHGEIINLSRAEGFYYSENEEINGLITYRIIDNEMEILSLDSLIPNKGYGTGLLNEAIQKARNTGCHRIMLITTNDNLNALRFYQKRGFDMVKLYRNAVDESRKLKPQIPLVGMDDIPIRHEIELELIL